MTLNVNTKMVKNMIANGNIIENVNKYECELY